MGGDRRKMTLKAGFEARNSQAAKDALRRRQKIKKARTVKRHVRYRDKKKLLEQLSKSEKSEVIVAENLSNPFENPDDKEPEFKLTRGNKKDETKPSSQKDSQKERNIETDETKKPEEDRRVSDKEPEKNTRKKKYTPFEKEQKYFEQVRKEREREQEERQSRVKERENMLNESKKRRNAKSKQYRKVTSHGQPKLKYKVDTILSKLEKDQQK